MMDGVLSISLKGTIMKIKDIINNLDRSDDNRVTDCVSTWYVEELDYDLFNMVETLIGYDGSQELQDWLTEHVDWFWITPWQCTDTWVGLSAMFYKGELMAILFKSGRKCDTNAEYTEVFNQFFDDYLQMAIKHVRKNPPAPLDLEKDITELPLSYPDQLLGNQAIVDGKLSVIRRMTKAEFQEQVGGQYRNFHHMFANGKLVSNQDVDVMIPFNLTEEKFKEVYGDNKNDD